MGAKHTPGTWSYWPKCLRDGGMITQDGTGVHVAVPVLYPHTPETTEANAARIVECVNGCEGLNPAAYREVLAALESIVELLGEDFYWDHGTVMAEVHDAITQAKGE